MKEQICELEDIIDEKDGIIDQLEDECNKLEEFLIQKDLEIKHLTESKLVRVNNPLGI